MNVNLLSALNVTRNGDGACVHFADVVVGTAHGKEAVALQWLNVARNHIGRTPLLPHEIGYIHSAAAFLTRHQCALPRELAAIVAREAELLSRAQETDEKPAG